MSRLESDQVLFRALASSGAVLPELVGYWQRLRDEAQQLLGNYAITALLKPELHNLALIQYGKVQMLTELIEYAEKYKQ